MLVSVGIPTYNRTEGLKRALDSVIGQTYQNIEIIISNNHSTITEVNEIIEDYCKSDNRIAYYNQETSLGMIGNFSFVKSVAKGKYFLWLADDDWLDSNYVEECVSFLEKNNDYSVAVGNCYYHKDFDTITNVNSNLTIEGGRPFFRVVRYYRIVTLNAYFYGVFRVRDVSRVNLRKIIGFDWIFVALLAYMGKIKVLNTTGSHIMHGGISNDITALNRHFDQRDFISRNFVGLRVALNNAQEIISDTNYTIGSLTKYLLAIFVFIIVYPRVFFWDIIFTKRRIFGWLGLSQNSF